MKKLLLLFILALIPILASADPVEIDGIWYNLTSDGKVAEVTYMPRDHDGDDYTGDVVIPEKVTYEGSDYSVTSIGHYAFCGCPNLTSVTIPNSVTSIVAQAFYQSRNLNSVTIGNSVTSMGPGAFEECESLTSVTIPNSVTEIGYYAFRGCTSLTSVTIGNSVTFIGDRAFEECESLTSITIPNSVTELGSETFAYCSSLTSVTIGNNVPRIMNNVFRSCSALTSVTIGNSVTSIGGWAFAFCRSLTSITIPNSVTHIWSGAFYTCSSLTSVIIGSGVESISEKAFGSCPELSDVYCLAENVPETYSDAFEGSNISNNATLHVPNVSVDVYKATEPWKNFKFIVSMGNTKHKLIYLVDNIEYKTYEVEYGAAITPEPEPTKEGYTFSGWSEIPATMPAHDVTVTGSFNVNKYTLTYKVDGVDYKTYEVEYGTAITPEEEPTKEGYAFSGWSEIPSTMPAHDVTVTGSFNINKYTLTYKVDGVDYKTYEIEYGAAITPEPKPTKEGYTFSGWSEIPSTMPAHDVTVTGSFNVNKYTLTYKVDGVDYKTYEIEYGAAITPEPEPTKEGYTFSGWSEIPITMPAHDVTVTGSFSKGQYQLTYMVDGQVYKTISYDYNDVVTPEPEPQREGYTFSGWSEIPATMPAHDVTVSGSFAINKYTLTYMVDGEVYKSVEVEYDTEIVPEDEPTKEGYTFSGWSWIPSKMPGEDVTVTGSFTVNSYKLTYMIDDKVYKEVTYEYGATITPEPQPEGDYQTFEWVNLPETMPAHDVMVYASYTTDIAKTLTSPQRNAKIYSLDGKPQVTLQKGLNIVRMNDGTTKKVVVK